MDGRVSVRDAVGPHPGAARRRPVGQRHHLPRRPAVHRRVPRGRPADGVRPRRRSAADPPGERPVAQRDGGRPRRPALLPGDGRQRDLAHRSRRRAATQKSSPPGSAFPTRSSSTPTVSSCRPRWPAARCCASIPRTGEQTVLAQLTPGLDNCTFVGRFEAAVRLELHRRDHRDPRRRRDQDHASRCAELADGSRRRRRRHASTSPTAPTSTRWQPDGSLRDRRHAVLARLSGLPARAGAVRARRVRRHHVRWPDRPATGPRPTNATIWQTVSTSSTVWR